MNDRAAVPRRDTYDVVIVGGGLGGLTAGACAARAGRSVLVVDRQDGPGGFAHSFKRGELVFDPATHVTTGFGDDQPGGLLLNALGVRDQVEFIRPEIYFGARYPGFEMLAPAGVEPLIEAHVRALPECAGELETFLRTCERVYRESRQLGFSADMKELAQGVERFPTFFKYRNATVSEALDEMVFDPRARGLCATLWPYMAVPPERLPMSQLGAYLFGVGEAPLGVKGGFQRLADALVAAISAGGGDLVLETDVTGIDVVDGRATGIKLPNGTSIGAGIVVSNVDATQTFNELIGREHVPSRTLRRLDKLRPSLSAFIVHAATSLDLSNLPLGHETFVHPDWDHARNFERAVAGEPTSFWVTTPSRDDPTLAPAGQQIVTISAPTAYDVGEPWDARRERTADVLLGRAEQAIPGLRDNLTHLETSTPESFARVMRSRDGAAYGWELSLDQMTTKRMRQDTGIEGLLLAGHWAEHGAGSLRAMLSGLGAAQRILGVPHMGALFERLRA